MAQTLVTEVSFSPVKSSNGLIGFVEFLVDEKFYCGGVGVYTLLDGSGFRLVYPTKKIGSGQIPLFHPIDTETGEDIRRAVSDEVKRLIVPERIEYD